MNYRLISNPVQFSWVEKRHFSATFAKPVSFKGFEFVGGPFLTLDQAMAAEKDARITEWLNGVYDVIAWQMEERAT